MTDCSQQTFRFQALGPRKVEADFKGGNLSADGGVVLLREVDDQAGLIEGLAGCFQVFPISYQSFYRKISPQFYQSMSRAGIGWCTSRRQSRTRPLNDRAGRRHQGNFKMRSISATLSSWFIA
jgi:hypothetical protein